MNIKKIKHINLSKKTCLILICIFVVLFFGTTIYGYYDTIGDYKTLDIYLASKSMQDYNYNIDTFNCQNFSMTLKNKLSDYNVLFIAGYHIESNYYIVEMSNENISSIKSIPTIGKINAHEWIYIVDYNLYIEATNGTVIPNSEVTYLN